jgi:uncharacterized RDD family membrane protein YckC
MQPCSCGLAHDESFGYCPITVSDPAMQTPLIDTPVQEPASGARRRGGRKKSTNIGLENAPASTLIEFPGVSRSVPEWRKQLSQRVREVQEQRAREAAEAAAATRASESVSCALPSGQLELVPELEQAPLNPIVSKALERVDRARRGEHLSTGVPSTATAATLAPEREEVTEPPTGETKPKLTIVTSVTETPDQEAVTEEFVVTEPEIKEPEPAQQTQPKTKPVRVISERVEDVALSYLETCLSVPALPCDSRNHSAGLARRTVGGTLDLLLIGLMVSPAVAAIHFSGGDWSDTRVIGLMAGISVITMFAYLTLSIALTGRTLSMRWLSLRTIDLRTGMIPTGGQAIKRALSYIFSLGLLGLGLAYALIDPDRRTAPDRFSKTIVIRD